MIRIPGFRIRGQRHVHIRPPRLSVASGVRPVITSEGFGGGDAANIAGRSTDCAFGGTAKTWVSSGSDLGIVSGRFGHSSGTAARRAGFDMGAGNVFVRLVAPAGSVATLTLQLRRTDATTATQDNYNALVDFGAMTVTLRKTVSAAVTTLSSALPFVLGDEIGVLVSGSRVVLVKNGQILAQVVDTDVPSTGTFLTIAWANTCNAFVDNVRVEAA